MSKVDDLLAKYANIPGERFFDDIFKGEEYKDALRVKADVVLDIGACAGEFSAYIYDKAGIIYALEPQKDHYKELATNVEEFGLDKIKPFNLALSNSNGEDKLSIAGRGSHYLSGGGTEKVKTKTLATFMRENNIDHVDILKIDIEGGEERVFKSLDFKEVADKISFIIGEHIAIVSETLIGYGFVKQGEGKNSVYIK